MLDNDEWVGPSESMNREEARLQGDPFMASLPSINEVDKANMDLDGEGEEALPEYDGLMGEILRVYQRNKDSKTNSLIDQNISEDLRAVQGIYDPEDMALIQENQQSSIFMNLSATKSRAAQSWIKDILLNANNDAYGIQPTPIPDIPSDLNQMLTVHFEKEAKKRVEEMRKEKQDEADAKKKAEQEKEAKKQQAAQQAQAPGGAPGGAQAVQGAVPGAQGQGQGQGAPPQGRGQGQGQGQGPGMGTPPQGAPAPPQAQGPQPMPAPQAQAPPQPPNKPEGQTVAQAQDLLLETNRLEREVREAILEEINSMALFEVNILEEKIKDQMKEGKWEEALSEFIEDFCTFPSAIMKGPVIAKKKKLEWVQGKAVATERHVFLNSRVSPYDVYPDPSSTTPQEGSFIEHLRLSEKDVRSCFDLPYYHASNLEEVLDNGPTGLPSFDSNVEYDKAELEKRGTEWAANEDIYHGLHYWASVSAELLEDWDLEEKMTEVEPDWDETTIFEIEAIVIGSTIIKCKINEDPLQRRPYYKASYQSVPGSFWGRSLPSLMRDIQRMCNATARALATNMGYSSGPLFTVNVDRLADEGDIDELRPLMTIQVTNDPTGNSGRPVEAFLVPSVANELLAVYDRFEIKADDATGIPRYAYGNERVGGAGQTASGLSMLMDSATKSIKDAIRHISYGLIIPRVEYEFYWLLIREDSIRYSGDINVIAKGAEMLTVSGAMEAKRNEFLQITANQMDQQVMGPEGRAVVLREMAKDLNLPATIVPSRLELAKRKKEGEAKQADMMKMEMMKEQQKGQTGLKATQIQVEGQQKMHAETMGLKMQEVQQKQQAHIDKMQIEIERLRTNKSIADGRVLADSNKAVMGDMQARDIQDQKAAVEMKKLETIPGKI